MNKSNRVPISLIKLAVVCLVGFIGLTGFHCIQKMHDTGERLLELGQTHWRGETGPTTIILVRHF